MKDCMASGHLYVEITVARRMDDGFTFNFVGKGRICKTCKKEQVHYHGVWTDAPKQEKQKKREPEPVDDRQMSLF